MSATNRSQVRRADDAYYTPAWAVHRLLEKCELPGQRWFDPCAGDGAIIRATREYGYLWTANEIDKDKANWLLSLCPNVSSSDFLLWGSGPALYDVILTNPPYSLAGEFIVQSLRYARTVAMLLRLSFLESIERATFFHAHMPEVYVLPNRPTFVKVRTYLPTGNTRVSTGDSAAYAWMVWRPERSNVSRVQVLDLTPSSVLKEARALVPTINVEAA